jgi:hypothetical protein
VLTAMVCVIAAIVKVIHQNIAAVNIDISTSPGTARYRWANCHKAYDYPGGVIYLNVSRWGILLVS